MEFNQNVCLPLNSIKVFEWVKISKTVDFCIMLHPNQTSIEKWTTRKERVNMPPTLLGGWLTLLDTFGGLDFFTDHWYVSYPQSVKKNSCADQCIAIFLMIGGFPPVFSPQPTPFFYNFSALFYLVSTKRNGCQVNISGLVCHN